MAGRYQVAVVTPTFNRRDLVVQAVRSALAQDGVDLRCIVVDNGSTDGTAGALAALEDTRVNLMTIDRPIGGPAARNLGIRTAGDAEWVAFLDSDDIWAPQKLKYQLAAAHACPEARWSATACVNVDEHLNVRNALRLTEGPQTIDTDVLLSPSAVRALLEVDNRVPAGNSTVMVSRPFMESVGGFDTNLATCDDWDLWLRLASASPLSYVDLPLAAYRIWDGQSSINERAFIPDAATVRARHFPEAGPLPKGYIARWEREAARRHVAGDRRWPATRSYMRAAWTGRQPRQLVYGLAALCSPRATERRLRRIETTQRLPEDWQARVEPWLAPYRTA